jgi:hypothetical protein
MNNQLWKVFNVDGVATLFKDLQVLSVFCLVDIYDSIINTNPDFIELYIKVNELEYVRLSEVNVRTSIAPDTFCYVATTY